MGNEISARIVGTLVFLVDLVDLVRLVFFVLRTKPTKQTRQTKQTRSADQIGVEPIHWLDREGFDFVIDDRASCLSKAREDSFHNHLVAIPNFDLTETDDFQCAGLILQEKPIGRLTFPIRRELDVGDLAGDHHFLAVVLLRMGEEFGDLQKTRCVNTPWCRGEGE